MKITISQLRRLIQETYEADTAHIFTKAKELKDLYGSNYVVGDPNAYTDLKNFVEEENPSDPANASIVEKMAQDFERAAFDASTAAKKRGYRSRVIR